MNKMRMENEQKTHMRRMHKNKGDFMYAMPDKIFRTWKKND